MNRFQTNLAIAGLSILALAGHTGFAAEIGWATDLGAAQRQATQERKLLLLHFQSKDCAPCQTLEATVFADEAVVAAVNEKYVPVRVDVDELPELAAQFQVKSWPTDVIVTTEGQQLYRGVSPAKPNVYRTQLEMIAQLATPVENPVADYDRATAQPSQFDHPGQNASFATAGMNDPYGADSRYAASSGAEAGSENASPEMAAYSPPKEEIWAPSNASPAHDPYAAQPPEVSLSQSPRDPTAYGKPDAAMAATPQFDAPAASTAAYGAGSYDLPANGPAANPYQQVAYGNAGATSASQASGFDSAMPPTDSIDSRVSSGVSAGIPTVPASFARPGAAAPSRDLRLGLEGNCPVSLIVRQSWTKGDPRFGAKHRGVVYLFADAASRDMFLADPDAFSLAWQGIDAVEFVDYGRAVVGKCEFGFAADSGIVLFSSEENLNKFGADKQAEDRYIQKMDELLRQRTSVAAGVAPAQR